MAFNDLLVGVSRRTDDSMTVPRGGNQGEALVGELNPKYFEQCLRGNAFVYSTPAAGAVLNVLGTTSAPFLWNPLGSGRILVIHKIVAGLVATGTTAAGHIVYGYQNDLGSQIGTGAPVVSGTFVAGKNTNLGHPNTSKMKFSPTTVSLSAACTFMCSAGWGQATAATTATPPISFIDDVDGRIIIPEGSAFSIAASAAIASSYSIAIYGIELPNPLTV
jgi:hypothetical protein